LCIGGKGGGGLWGGRGRAWCVGGGGGGGGGGGDFGLAEQFWFLNKGSTARG